MSTHSNSAGKNAVRVMQFYPYLFEVGDPRKLEYLRYVAPSNYLSIIWQSETDPELRVHDETTPNGHPVIGGQGVQGIPGPQGVGINGAPGANGFSTYEIAVSQGFVGTEADFIASIRGDLGPQGNSAYDVARNNGYVGTVSAWLLSLVGSQGMAGPDGPVGPEGPDGRDGAPGAPGVPGRDGVAPVITLNENADGTRTLNVNGNSIILNDDGIQDFSITGNTMKIVTNNGDEYPVDVFPPKSVSNAVDNGDGTYTLLLADGTLITIETQPPVAPIEFPLLYVDKQTDLSALTPAEVEVGQIVRVSSTDVTYIRVAGGGDTAGAGVSFTNLSRRTELAMQHWAAQPANTLFVVNGLRYRVDPTIVGAQSATHDLNVNGITLDLQDLRTLPDDLGLSNVLSFSGDSRPDLQSRHPPQITFVPNHPVLGASVRISDNVGKSLVGKKHHKARGRVHQSDFELYVEAVTDANLVYRHVAWCYDDNFDFISAVQGVGLFATGTDIGTKIESTYKFGGIGSFGTDTQNALIDTAAYVRTGIQINEISAYTLFIANLEHHNATPSELTENRIRLSSEVMYVNTGQNLVPFLDRDGLLNFENGMLRLFCDIEGDGDVDADIFGATGNLYVAAKNDIHLRVNVDPFGNHVNEGRLVISSNADALSLQCGVTYSGSGERNLAFGPLRSGRYYGVFNSVTGNFGVGLGLNAVDPEARLHVRDGATTVATFESAVANSRIGFKAAGQPNTDDAAIGTDSGNRLVLRGGGADVVKIGATSVQAAVGGVGLIGTASFPFAGGNVVTAFNVTSDKRKKQDIKSIPDTVLDAMSEVNFCEFRLISEVGQYGDKADRHAGLIAQDLVKAFEKYGEDAHDWGVLVLNTWEAEYEDIYVEHIEKEEIFEYKTEIHTEEVETETENGEVSTAKSSARQETAIPTGEFKEIKTQVPSGKRKKVKSAGSVYSVRYEQVLVLEAALARRTTQRLQEKLEALTKAK